MPIIRTSKGHLTQTNRPKWCGATAAGIFRVPEVGGRFDRHFHDCDEFWLIFKGKAKVLSEGVEYFVHKGDIIFTRARDEHDVLEVYEEFEAFYFEAATPEGGRTGHLHRAPELAEGHAVPHLPVPNDFPYS